LVQCADAQVTHGLGEPTHNYFIGRYTIREDNPANEFKMDQKQLIKSFEELAIHCDFYLLQVHFSFDKNTKEIFRTIYLN